MSAARVLVVVVVVSWLAACNTDDGANGSSSPSAFRNLGKRGDSNLAGERSAALP